MELYRKNGYQEVKLPDPLWLRAFRKDNDVIMCKPLPPLISSCHKLGVQDGQSEAQSLTRTERLGGSDEVRTQSKVYNWDMED